LQKISKTPDIKNINLNIEQKNVLSLQRINYEEMLQGSHLTNKSGILKDAEKILNDKCLYAAVPHCSYYSCLQLMKHIWIHTLGNTEVELESQCSIAKTGSHKVLINNIGSYIKEKNTEDFRKFNPKISQLKRLRIDSDYKDILCDSSMSAKSMHLSNEIIPILKKY